METGDPERCLNAAEYSDSDGIGNSYNIFANIANTYQLEARRSPQNTWITGDSESAVGSSRLLHNKQNCGMGMPENSLKRRGIQRFRGRHSFFLQTSWALANWRPTDRLKTRGLHGVLRRQKMSREYQNLQKIVKRVPPFSKSVKTLTRVGDWEGVGEPGNHRKS